MKIRISRSNSGGRRGSLNAELDRLGRIIARILVSKGPEGVNLLGPYVIKFRETEADLKKLSCRVIGAFPDSYNTSNP